MKTILDDSRTWFFDGLSQRPDGSLIIELAEGIKADEPESVDFGTGTPIGSFYAIQVLPQSKCVKVEFQKAHLFFVYNESFDVGDDLLDGEEGVLGKLSTSSFQNYIESHTGISNLSNKKYDSYLLWTEDYVFHVASSEAPTVTLTEKHPDLSIERTTTWSAT